MEANRTELKLILTPDDVNHLGLAMSLFRLNIKALKSEDAEPFAMPHHWKKGFPVVEDEAFALDAELAQDLRTAQEKIRTALDGGTDEPFTDAELHAAERALSWCAYRYAPWLARLVGWAPLKEFFPDEHFASWEHHAAGWCHVHGLITSHVSIEKLQ